MIGPRAESNEAPEVAPDTRRGFVLSRGRGGDDVAPKKPKKPC